MQITALIRRSHYIPVVVILCAIAAASCSAVTMDVDAGFNGAVKASAWIPIAVKLDNNDSGAVSGILNIERQVGGNQIPLPMCTTQVEMPANSHKLFYLYTRMSTYSGNLRVTLNGRFGKIAEKQVQVSPVADTEKLVVSVGEKSSRLSFLTGEKVKAMPATISYYNNSSSGSGSPDAAIYVGSVESNGLPDRPAAYDSVDVMVISSLNPASASSKSLAAIASWVAAGGTLVVATGANYQAYQNEFYDDLLPVSITGAANLEGLSSLSKLGGAAFPAGPVAVAQSALKPGIGRAIESEAGLPIIAERDYGSGKVIFFAFDHMSAPFNTWGGQIAFWKYIISNAYSTPFVSSTADRLYTNNSQYYNVSDILRQTDLASVVARQMTVKAPSVSVIGLFLLAYLIALVPANYIFLKKKRRMEMVWITTPVIVLAFTLGAYAIGYTMKGGRLQIREARLISGSSNARYASVISDCALFSPVRRSYDINVNDPNSVCQALAMDKSETLPDVYLGEKSIVSDVSMSMWASKTFESVGGMDLEGTLDADLTLNGSTIQGKIINNTNLRLEDCRVYYGSACSRIGTLSKGGSADVNTTFAPNNYAPNSNQNYYGDDSVDLGLADMIGSKVTYADGPVLVAKVVSSAPTFEVSGAEEDVATYSIFRLNYKATGTFKLDGSMIKGKIVECNAAGLESGELGSCNIIDNKTPIQIRNGGYAIVKYDVPVPLNGAITSMNLTFTPTFASSSPSAAPSAAGASSPALSEFNISVYNYAASRWDIIKSASANVDPANYLNSGNRVKVKLLYARGGERSIIVGVNAAGKQR